MNKPPPHNIEIEQAVIGSFIEYPEVRDEIMLNVRKDMFYKQGNKEFYDTLLKIYSENAKFSKEHCLNEFKDQSYELVKCLDMVVSSAKCTQHIRELTEIYNRRELFLLGLKIVDTCDNFPSHKTRLAIENRLNQLSNGHYEIKSLKDIIEENNSEEKYIELTTPCVKTGLYEFDSNVIIQKADMVILAGRPSHGKTAFMLCLAERFANNKHKVGIISIEMKDNSLVQRLASSKTDHIGFDGYLIGCQDIYNLPIYINDNENYNLVQVVNISQSMIKRYYVDILFIDYLQLMEGDTDKRLIEQINQISKGLKQTAKKFDIPIVPLAQLNRKIEDRKNHKPMLSDLRESGQIEQDADIVLFAHYPNAYPTLRDESKENYWELIISKQRKGPANKTVKWHWEKERNYFKPITEKNDKN